MSGPHDATRPLMSDIERNDDNFDVESSTGPERGRDKTAAYVTTTTLASASEGETSRADADHPDAPLDESRDDRSHLEVEEESHPSTPRFYQDEHAWKRWRWVPSPVRRAIQRVVKWSKGPSPPRQYRIRPILPNAQEYPLLLVKRFLPQLKHRVWLLFFYFSLWLIIFCLVKRQGSLSVQIRGWGEPQDIGCGVTYWGQDNTCGLDGNDCRPFLSSGFPFRCSADCLSYQLSEPRAVGAQEINYDTFVIGGPSSGGVDVNATYRGDSFICQAALHAGVIDNAHGGCGVVSLVGNMANFVSSSKNGITSIGFDSYFPLSFTFVPNIDCAADDMRWSLLAVTAVFTGLLSIFTSSPALFFFPGFIAIFWTVGMALDPPNSTSVADLFSDILGKFLPAMFIAWVMYDRMGVRRTLKGLTAQVEKTVLWLGPCWVGALNNYTFSWIPISRLNSHDLNQQPGAKAALAIIIIVLVVIVATQIYFFRQEARLRKYLALYAVFILAILISLSLPGLSLRLHHYILGLLLLPGTSMQTRPALIYQGLCVGLFMDGVARWGFDSVLQTPAALQGNAPLESGLPTILPPHITRANSSVPISTITLKWETPTEFEFDGISILVNDVERFRTYFDDEMNPETQFLWTRNKTLNMPEYFRFGFMDGSNSADYTQAGTWTAEGDWVEMKPGPSRRSVGGPQQNEVLKRRR